MDPTTLFASVVFGSVGIGYAIYGRKQSRPLFLVSGIALGILPFFLTGVALVGVCALLTAAPFVAGRWVDW